MRLRYALLLIATAIPALADDVPAPVFRSIEAEASLESDGSITLIEKELIENPSSSPAVIKRRYWTDSDEKIDLVSIEPPAPHKLESWGQLAMTVPSGVTNYTITTRVHGAVTPVWAIPRGVRTLDSNDFLADPRARIREILAVWRDRGANPRARYLFDYQYLYPEQHETYVVNPSISFGHEWHPVHTIRPGAIGTQIKAASVYYPDSFRIRHLFDYRNAGAPNAIDLRKYALRVGSIALFPIAALVLWLAYFAWITLRGRAPQSDIDDRWLRDNILNQPPEIIRAKWSGSLETPEIEPFLRRLERAGKISLDVQTINKDTDDEEDLVTVRLRVDRSRLSDYERAVINALMPNADEITSQDVAKAHAGEEFDPMDAATEWLQRAMPRKKRSAGAPLVSRLLTGLLFVGGTVLLVAGTLRDGQGFIALIAAIAITNFLIAMWPSMRNARTALLLAVIPCAALFALVVLVQTITYQPPGEFVSLGATIFALGGFNGILANASKAESIPRELARARDWLAAQQHVRDEWVPYLEALDLRKPQPSEDDWGYAFSTYADD